MDSYTGRIAFCSRSFDNSIHDAYDWTDASQRSKATVSCFIGFVDIFLFSVFGVIMS
jgi:hypothetical protein